jgi:hypothetical protein
VREQKYHLLRAKYDEFKMLPNESCNESYSRLNVIVKDINALNVSKIDKGVKIGRFSCFSTNLSTTS